MDSTDATALQAAMLCSTKTNSGRAPDAGGSGRIVAFLLTAVAGLSGCNAENPCSHLKDMVPGVVAADISIAPSSDAFTSNRQVIARSVGDDLYIEISWSAFRPFPTEGTPDTVRVRVGLRILGAMGDAASAFDLSDPRVEIFGVEHYAAEPPSWGRLRPDDAPPVGCIAVRQNGASTDVSLRLSATLTPRGVSDGSHREPVDLEIEDAVSVEAEPRASYSGECSGHANAYYVPLQAPDYEVDFRSWARVEGDCKSGRSGQCLATRAGECGDGDRWLCRYCFDDACLEPEFQSECFPR